MFSIDDFFRKCGQMRRWLRISTHLLNNDFNGRLKILCTAGNHNFENLEKVRKLRGKRLTLFKYLHPAIYKFIEQKMRLRGLCSIQPNIYDGVFFLKSSTTDVRPSSTYASPIRIFCQWIFQNFAKSYSAGLLQMVVFEKKIFSNDCKCEVVG